jgi:RimJ/RimL family protein N-acetyltransferase
MRWPLELPGPLGDGDVRLDVYGSSDSDELFEAIRADEVWEHLPAAIPTTAAELDASIRSRLSGGNRMTFTMRQGGVVVGTTSVLFDPHAPEGAEIGATQLAPAVWGTGLNGTAKRLLIDWLFASGAAWIGFRTDERNERSAAAIRKLGARDLGVHEDVRVRRDGTARRSRMFRLAEPPP